MVRELTCQSRGLLVRSLGREDCTCCRATQPESCRLLKPGALDPVLRNEKPLMYEKPALRNQRADSRRSR